MNGLHLIYKRETGNDVVETELGVVRRKGVYVLDSQNVDDEIVFDAFGHNFNVVIPDFAYIGWMEEKLKELLNK